MTDDMADDIMSQSDEEGGDFSIPKMTDITISTVEDSSDEPENRHSIGVGDLNAAIDDGDLPEDDDIFGSSDFGSSDNLVEVAAVAGSMVQISNKEEVRKSILKGKSALSTSRQKNNILKAVPVDTSALHSSFNKPRAGGGGGKLAPSGGGGGGPPITEPPQPHLKAGRSFSHDDLAGLAAGGGKPSPLSGRSLSASDEESKSHRRSSTSSAMRPGLQSLAGTLKNPTGPLHVDTKTIADLVGGSSGSGPKPTRSLPSRSKSGPMHSMAAAATGGGGGGGGGGKRKPPARTTSFDGGFTSNTFPELADVAGRLSKLSKGTDNSPRTKKTSVESTASTTPDGSTTQSKADQQDNNNSNMNGSRQVAIKTRQNEANGSQNDQQKQKQQQGEEPLISKQHGSPQSPSETDTKDKKSAQTKDPDHHSVSARQSAHSSNSNQSRHSGSKEEELIVMWSCWACEYDYNVAEHVFCGMCGTGRDWHCPSCSHDNKSTFNFCGMCGTRKGRVIIHKQQPELFNMRMHKGTKKKTTTTNKKVSSNISSSRIPASPVKSVASSAAKSTLSKYPGSPVKSVVSNTARSTSRRSSARNAPRPPKLDTADGSMSAASDRISTVRNNKSDDASAVSQSERLSSSRVGGPENNIGDQQQQQQPLHQMPEKRSSRGRGREKRESKRAESKTRGESKNRGESRTRGESKQRGNKNNRTRSTSRAGRDGKERKRNSVVGGDEKKSRKHKSSKHKGEKVRRPRVSSSVPPGERPGERGTETNKDGLIKAAERPVMARSNSESKVESIVVTAKNSSTPTTDEGAGEGGKEKSWLKKFTGKTSEESKGILNGDLNATDHSMWRDLKQRGDEAFRGSTNSTASATSKGDDVLATPSIKKRLLKMSGKVGGIPGKLFKSNDLLPPDESQSENRSAEVTITRSSSGDNMDSSHFQKQFQKQQQDGGAPFTPSLKKRLLGSVTMGWGKSGHDRPPPPMLGLEPSPVPTAATEESETLAEADDIVDSDDEKEFPSMGPLDGISQGLVVTAKDMRPNRPTSTARKQQNPNVTRARRQSKHGVLNLEGGERKNGRGDRDRRRPSAVRRTKSGDHMPSRKTTTSNGSISSFGGRSDSRIESSALSKDDPLGDMSEDESIESLEM